MRGFGFFVGAILRSIRSIRNAKVFGQVVPYVQEIEHRRQKTLFYSVYGCGVLSSILLLGYSIWKGDGLSIAVNSSVLLVAASILAFLKLSQNLRVTNSLLLACMGAVFTIVYYTNSAGRAGFLWFYTYPLLSFLLMGRKAGLLFTIVFCVLPVALAVGVKPDLFALYASQELIRHAVIFCVITMLVWSSEHYRELSQARLVREAESRRKDAKIRSEFLTKISHELKTPLNSIHYTLNALLEFKLSKKAKALTQQGLDGSYTLMKLITDSVNLAHVGSASPETQGLEYETESIFDLRETLADIEKEFFEKARLKQKTFRMVLRSSLPSAVKGYPIRFRMLVVHLLNKALKTVREGDLVFSAAIQRRHQHYTTVQFVISGSRQFLTLRENNTDSRIAPQKLSVAEPSRGDESRATAFASITDKLADGLGTKIQVKTHGQFDDACIALHFPLTFGLVGDSEGVVAFKMDDNLRQKKALLVSSDPLMEVLVREISSQEGWDVFWAKNPDSPPNLSRLRGHSTPLETNKKNLYDLVLFHVGEELGGAKDIKKAVSQYKNTPVLFLSEGSFHPPKLPKSMNIAQKTLKNSFQYKDFFRTVQSLFEEQESQSNKQSPTKEQPILVVEDNLVNQKVIKGLLSGLGYKNIELAVNGLQAMERISERTYDLILMDCNLPEMDGYQTTKAIRQIENHKPHYEHTVVVALTANTILGDRDKCFASGMDDYLSKPISKERLKEVLEKYLGGRHYGSVQSSKTKKKVA